MHLICIETGPSVKRAVLASPVDPPADRAPAAAIASAAISARRARGWRGFMVVSRFRRDYTSMSM